MPTAAPSEDTISSSEWVEVAVVLSSPGAQRRLGSLMANAGYRSDRFLEQARDYVAESLESLDAGLTQDGVVVAFVCSAILDLQAWGARCDIRESRLYVSTPRVLKNTPEVRARLRAAMLRLKGAPDRYVPPVSGDVALQLLQDGTLELTNASDDPEAAQVFRDGITSWSMPYRSREGRSTRFVLFVNHDRIRVPVGLLEIGDDAPHNPMRDQALGLTTDSLAPGDLPAFAKRLRRFRHALNGDGLPVSPTAPLAELVGRVEDLRALGRGRSGDATEVSHRKRLTYLARLAGAEAASKAMRGSDPRAIAEGIRAVKDVCVPRVHTEMVICGALPPFGPLLAGKLVASMAAHPLVRQQLDRPFGEITAGLFDTARLDRLVPRSGPFLVTTKGLYPEHSAQYSGVRMPTASSGGLKMRKIGDTSGQTISHLSADTMRLATAMTAGSGDRVVSRAYGSGGAKRQRTVGQAAILAGLPASFGYAWVSRPVYGLPLVANPGDVLLLGGTPEWIADRYTRSLSGAEYEGQALALWRHRWLATVEKRHVGEGLQWETSA